MVFLSYLKDLFAILMKYFSYYERPILIFLNTSLKTLAMNSVLV